MATTKVYMPAARDGKNMSGKYGFSKADLVRLQIALNEMAMAKEREAHTSEQ